MIERPDFAEELERLRRAKISLWGLSTGIVIILFSQIGLLAWAAVTTFTQLRRPSISEYIADRLLIYLLAALALFFFLAAMAVVFERMVRSARIVSSEFADAIGWYRTHSSTDGSSYRADSDVPSYARDSDSLFPVGKGQLMQARILLREIAENSSLPLLRNESASFLYLMLSIVCFWSKAGSHMSYSFDKRRETDYESDPNAVS